MKYFKYYTAVSFIFFLATAIVFARFFRKDQIPNGTINTCANCHIDPNGEGARNDFGLEVQNNFLDAGNVVWGLELASLDSDGDDVPNGVELQDPNGEWAEEQPAPGNANLVTLPGDASSFIDGLLTVQFADMTPHIGQKLELRLINKNDLLELYRTAVDPISGAEFNTVLDGLKDGGSYYVDFYADLNENGQYDAPPVDHAWRLNIDNVDGTTEILKFNHNTDFTDIGWPTGIVNHFQNGLPQTFTLSQNFPNPFNPSTQIDFDIPNAGVIRIEIFNVLGQRVNSLLDNYIAAGSYTVNWDGLDQFGNQVVSGTYFYRMTAENFMAVKRMLLLR
jgi:hypothetical protein